MKRKLLLAFLISTVFSIFYMACANAQTYPSVEYDLLPQKVTLPVGTNLTPNPAPTPFLFLGLGEVCNKDIDCKPGLDCLIGVCAPSGRPRDPFESDRSPNDGEGGPPDKRDNSVLTYPISIKIKF